MVAVTPVAFDREQQQQHETHGGCCGAAEIDYSPQQQQAEIGRLIFDALRIQERES